MFTTLQRAQLLPAANQLLSNNLDKKDFDPVRELLRLLSNTSSLHDYVNPLTVSGEDSKPTGDGPGGQKIADFNAAIAAGYVEHGGKATTVAHTARELSAAFRKSSLYENLFDRRLAIILAAIDAYVNPPSVTKKREGAAPKMFKNGMEVEAGPGSYLTPGSSGVVVKTRRSAMGQTVTVRWSDSRTQTYSVSADAAQSAQSPIRVKGTLVTDPVKTKSWPELLKHWLGRYEGRSEQLRLKPRALEKLIPSTSVTGRPGQGPALSGGAASPLFVTNQRGRIARVFEALSYASKALLTAAASGDGKVAGDAATKDQAMLLELCNHIQRCLLLDALTAFQQYEQACFQANERAAQPKERSSGTNKEPAIPCILQNASFVSFLIYCDHMFQHCADLLSTASLALTYASSTTSQESTKDLEAKQQKIEAVLRASALGRLLPLVAASLGFFTTHLSIVQLLLPTLVSLVRLCDTVNQHLPGALQTEQALMRLETVQFTDINKMAADGADGSKEPDEAFHGSMWAMFDFGEEDEQKSTDGGEGAGPGGPFSGHSIHWLLDVQKTLAVVSGRMAARAIAASAETSDEEKLSAWLKGCAMSGGLDPFVTEQMLRTLGGVPCEWETEAATVRSLASSFSHAHVISTFFLSRMDIRT